MMKYSQVSENIDIGLESISTLLDLRKFSANNRVTESERFLIKQNVNLISKTLGLSASAVSIESGSKWVNQQHALENTIGSLLNGIWEGIKAFFRRIKEFFKGLFGMKSSDSVSKAVEKREAVISKIDVKKINVAMSMIRPKENLLEILKKMKLHNINHQPIDTFENADKVFKNIQSGSEPDKFFNNCIIKTDGLGSNFLTYEDLKYTSGKKFTVGALEITWGLQELKAECDRFSRMLQSAGDYIDKAIKGEDISKIGLSSLVKEMDRLKKITRRGPYKPQISDEAVPMREVYGQHLITVTSAGDYQIKEDLEGLKTASTLDIKKLTVDNPPEFYISILRKEEVYDIAEEITKLNSFIDSNSEKNIDKVISKFESNSNKITEMIKDKDQTEEVKLTMELNKYLKAVIGVALKIVVLSKRANEEVTRIIGSDTQVYSGVAFILAELTASSNGLSTGSVRPLSTSEWAESVVADMNDPNVKSIEI